MTGRGAWDQLYREWIDGVVPQGPDRGWISVGAAVGDVIENLRRAKRRAWRRAYRQYLATAEWHMKRQRVLARCDGLCEGCMQQAASEVHHKTYAHVGEEFLDELVAYCDDCHRRIHRRNR